MSLRLSFLGTVPANSRAAILATINRTLCAYAVSVSSSPTPTPTQQPMVASPASSRSGSLPPRAQLLMTIGAGVGTALLVALAATVGVIAVRRRRADDAPAVEVADEGGCPHRASGDVTDDCNGGGSLTGDGDQDDGDGDRTDAGNGPKTEGCASGEAAAHVSAGAARGAAGAAGHAQTFVGSVVSSLSDPLTVEGLFYFLPERMPAGRRASDERSSRGSAEGSAFASVSDHMDVDGLVREALKWLAPPPPPA
eukprot:TRINITY_DN5697_c0_g1_i1.p2 TRINITY_DN5697_c0_g1~~TRINITY_DN5697_c0_g1_i1.p2  ORF type:complete len:253 (-),score=35.60 TRINITY_DN5697_c0_g1_i1:151-909(-)